MINDGTLYRFFIDDHRRLEDLLNRAAAGPTEGEPASYEVFRRGLLKHIGMEEKILLPAAQQARGGTPLPTAEKLRLDHGALATLLHEIGYTRRRGPKFLRNVYPVPLSVKMDADG